MPTYDYRCGVCGTVHAIERSIHEDTTVGVPYCCGSLAYRVFEPTPVRFNASGFYSTDHN